jgi:hypothetical protein
MGDAEVTAPATLARRLATVHPSTIALAWHLFGDATGRGLAAGWDTLSLLGESLFSLTGPVMHDDPAQARALQDAWENVFVPAA